MTDPRKLWQEQTETVPILSPEAIRQASARLARRAKWRAWRFYLAAVVWMPLIIVQAYTSPPPLIRWGSVLLILGGFFTIWKHARYLRDRRAVESKDFLETYRRQLAKERDFLRYHQNRHLLPFIPGSALILAGAAEIGMSIGEFAANVGGFILLFVWAWWQRGRAGRRIQFELDALGGKS